MIGWIAGTTRDDLIGKIIRFCQWLWWRITDNGKRYGWAKYDKVRIWSEPREEKEE